LSSAASAEIKRISQERSIILEVLSERGLLARPSKTLAVMQPSSVRPEIAQTTNRAYWKVKRLFDIFFAIAVIGAIAPIAAIVAVLVLIDVGYPVVFWQQRLGRLGRPLHVHKFRTMRAPFDRNGRLVPESERLSLIGRFLRAARLDEIAQLWNILSGGMSVVGPRPLLPVDQPKTFSMRLQVSPGLTGLAQISGGKLISVEEKDALDEHYVQRASLSLDLNILVRTFWVMFRGDVRNEQVIAAALAEKRGRAEARREVALAPKDAPVSATKTKEFMRVAKMDLTERPIAVGIRKKRA
jgi:lipopolysaccharide/colanic/teichoic acid biosynthesis glycosyltransferase